MSNKEYSLSVKGLDAIRRIQEDYCKKQKQELIEEFLQKLEVLNKHANHGTNAFENLAWVRNGIKNEIKLLKKRMRKNENNY